MGTDDKINEEFTNTTEAINQILVKANCPDKFRQYIFCLIGMADKDYGFEASDSTVAKYARGRISGGRGHADKGWAKDKRTDLLKWQADGNLILFEHEVRDYDKNKRIRPPSKYRLHILKYAEEVVATAQSNKSKWEVNPSLAIQKAAEQVVTQLMGKQTTGSKTKKYIDPSTEVRTKLKTAGTYVRQALELLEKHDFSLFIDDEKLLAEIEQIVGQIRERGFVDDILETIVFSDIERESDT